jgi:hypothetical protein
MSGSPQSAVDEKCWICVKADSFEIWLASIKAPSYLSLLKVKTAPSAEKSRKSSITLHPWNRQSSEIFKLNLRVLQIFDYLRFTVFLVPEFVNRKLLHPSNFRFLLQEFPLHFTTAPFSKFSKYFHGVRSSWLKFSRRNSTSSKFNANERKASKAFGSESFWKGSTFGAEFGTQLQLKSINLKVFKKKFHIRLLFQFPCRYVINRQIIVKRVYFQSVKAVPLDSTDFERIFVFPRN